MSGSQSALGALDAFPASRARLGAPFKRVMKLPKSYSNVYKQLILTTPGDALFYKNKRAIAITYLYTYT